MVAAIRRRVAHLQQHGAPLASVFNGKIFPTVYSAEITSALRAATTIIGPQEGFTPDDVSARSMQAGVTMDLLMSCVEIDTIRPMGRWRSNAMLRYLHTTSQTLTEGLAARMFHHGSYTFIPPAQGG